MTHQTPDESRVGAGISWAPGGRAPPQTVLGEQLASWRREPGTLSLTPSAGEDLSSSARPSPGRLDGTGHPERGPATCQRRGVCSPNVRHSRPSLWEDGAGPSEGGEGFAHLTWCCHPRYLMVRGRQPECGCSARGIVSVGCFLMTLVDFLSF